MKRRSVLFAVVACAGRLFATEPSMVSATPVELTNAVLHNPDMGWVLSENYAIDRAPNGSSTLLQLPGETFSNVDNITLTFSWQDIETRPDEYDFSNADFAYDYWAKRGKAIQLRLSAEPLLWWAGRNPPAGLGAPDYIRAKLAPNEKQHRTFSGIGYDVEDARNPYYRERLAKFLRAVNRHFSNKRLVTLIDLRGFGLWGEWHSGFRYATDDDRRAALKGVIKLWSDSLPGHRLALCYSYDPDGPKDLYSGGTRVFDTKFTTNYDKFLKFSAFDYALTKANIAWRRDGCGGAVHSNERKLDEGAFRLGRGPIFSEFVAGYADSKKGGDKWVKHEVDDALMLHPNYVMLMGWQTQDALNFSQERSDLIEDGLRRMGYRFVPVSVRCGASFAGKEPLRVEMDWVNRGVGRALRDYELQFLLLADDSRIVARSRPVKLQTSRWVAGQIYPFKTKARFDGVTPGNYQLGIAMRDGPDGTFIQLPLAKVGSNPFYQFGSLTVFVIK